VLAAVATATRVVEVDAARAGVLAAAGLATGQAVVAVVPGGTQQVPNPSPNPNVVEE